MLELLYLVPNSVTAQEAYSITETVRILKPFVMQELLEQCTSVKVKRLLLCFAELAGLSVDFVYLPVEKRETAFSGINSALERLKQSDPQKFNLQYEKLNEYFLA